MPGFVEAQLRASALQDLVRTFDIPAPIGDGAVGIARAVTGQRKFLARRDAQVGAGVGHRRLVHRHLDLREIGGIGVAAIVGDRQLDRVLAGLREGVGDDVAIGRAAIVEIPMITGDCAVRINRSATVEGDDFLRGGDHVEAGVGDRRGVDAYGKIVFGRVADRAGIVSDGQMDGIVVRGCCRYGRSWRRLPIGRRRNPRRTRRSRHRDQPIARRRNSPPTRSHIGPHLPQRRGAR